MKVISKNDLPQQGKPILIYRNRGVGKTTSILQSAPGSLLYIATEPLKPKPSIDMNKSQKEREMKKNDRIIK